MFVIIHGSNSETLRLGDAGERHCPACRCNTPFRLLFRYHYSHLYYLFGRLNSREYLIQCAKCRNTWPAAPDDVGDAAQHARVPFMRRWGCLTVVLGALISFGLLTLLGEMLGGHEDAIERQRLREFHRKAEERAKKAKEQGPEAPDEPDKAQPRPADDREP